MSVTAVLGAQWGDEGKGKIADILAQDADMVVRANGGNNAGHTVENEHTKNLSEGKAKFHIVPVGITNPDATNIIGAGCAVDLSVLTEELKQFGTDGVPRGELLISKNAHIVFPWHRWLDGAQELKRADDEKIGTTKRGIGPTFSDKYARRNLRMGDLVSLSDGELKEKVFDIYTEKELVLRYVYGLDTGDLRKLPSKWSVWYQTKHFAEMMREAGYVCDAEAVVRDAVKKDANVLLEGAQGVLLDIDHGTYPFCTSAPCTIAGLAQGAGIPPTDIDERIAIVKAYTTRIGPGAFPTQIHGEMDEWLRRQGAEFGATTGRPRWCGWIDYPLLNHIQSLNDFTAIAVTKLDVLTKLNTIPVGVGYQCDHSGLTTCANAQCGLEGAPAALQDLPSWDKHITRIRRRKSLPKEAEAYVRLIENTMGIPAKYISVGPKRHQIIRC